MPRASYRLDREIAGNPLPPDKRKGDRHKPGRVRDRTRVNRTDKDITKWERRLIVGWDGEGANVVEESGVVRHIYNLLANSDGTRILNHEGLRTVEVLDFFLKYGNPKAINVIYGGSYDVNMLLVDLPKSNLIELWNTGSTRWGYYRIYYTPRKKLTIQKHVKQPNGRYWRASFTLWDVIGFFQTSFVSACRRWLGELPILDEIEDMKWQRSEFTTDRIEDIIAYNQKECELLVQLMSALCAAMDVVGVKLQRYDGAGAVASALYKQNDVQSHKGEPQNFVFEHSAWGWYWPMSVVEYAQVAYSGGRIEACKTGNTEFEYQPIVWGSEIL